VNRIAALAERLDAPLLVTNLTNVLYQTGFESSNAALLVRPSAEATLYTDFRYAEAARASLDGVGMEITRRSLLGDVGARLKGRVLFEADVVAYLDWERLAAGGATLVPSQGIVEGLRAVKSEEEVAKLGRAARIADRAIEALTAETWVGRSERELAWRLRELVHAHGGDHLAFEPIVASGPNGAHPHGRPTDAIVERRMLVTVDWGVRAGGYCSDCTRTFSTGGGVPERLREAYAVCLDAQQKAVAGIEAGLTGVEADAIARGPIDAAGFGENFGHGLGHGVGLEVHEAPRLARSGETALAAGNVVTVEPGIYLPGRGGVRIEDLVVVTEAGHEVLSGTPKDLEVVG
jgi:Xaa-Pro aminopeptidase